MKRKHISLDDKLFWYWQENKLGLHTQFHLNGPWWQAAICVPKTPTRKQWFCHVLSKTGMSLLILPPKNALPSLFQHQSVPQNISKPIYLKNMGQLAFPRWHCLFWTKQLRIFLRFSLRWFWGHWSTHGSGPHPRCWVNHFMQITNLDESPFQLIFSTYKYSPI